MNQSNNSEEDYPWGLIIMGGIVIGMWMIDKWIQYDNAVYAARYKNMRDNYGNTPLI